MEQQLTSDNIINQDILRQVEALCTQEEPAACAAACPLHLDGRELCRLIAAGNESGALKLYQKAIPFARIIAATCDAPCQSRCKRAELGGAIRIGALERAVAATAKPAKPPLLVRKKEKRAAIAGGGLSAMAAANDLARKGYQVTIFEKSDTLGGRLRDLPEDVLPAAVLEEEIAALLALNIEVRTGVEVPLDSPQAATAFLLDGFDGAFVACSSPLDVLADGDTLLVQGQSALLAGRRTGRMTEGASSIYDMYDGRSAASSLDRIFQNVNIMAGREKEGSSDTTLYTNLAPFTAAAPVLPGEGGYTPQEARQEAARCLQCQCLECVKKCGFMQQYKRYPRQYVREVYNNLSIAMGQHHANDMINACALCGQCEAVCPNGLDMRQVFRAARERMVETEKMPPSAHEFALLDMDYSLSDAFYTVQHQPGYQASETVFFPGCQLGASEPALVRRVYEDLCQKLSGGVGLWLGCCGVMAHWAGEKAAFEGARRKLTADWEAMGRPRVLAGCPTCAATLQEQMGIPAETLFEPLSRQGAGQEALPADVPRAMVLHHACGARHRPDVQQQVAQCAAQAGIALSDAGYPAEQSPCCGYGGLAPFVNREVAGAITEVALQQLRPSGEDAPVLTYCVNCRDRYLAQGRPAWHVLELAYPGVETLNRKNPTWSQRQQNRAGLKRQLLQELWGIKREEEPGLQLFFEEGLEEKLENTHILHSDIAAAIRQAEAEVCKLRDPATGRFTTSYRPGNVTFWVQYVPEGQGYRVYNAYCHRMLAVLTDTMTQGGAADE